MSFENTRFVIVGATGGIGSALARMPRSQGAELILLARSPERLVSPGQELDSQTHPIDATKADELQETVRGFGRSTES